MAQSVKKKTSGGDLALGLTTIVSPFIAASPPLNCLTLTICSELIVVTARNLPDFGSSIVETGLFMPLRCGIKYLDYLYHLQGSTLRRFLLLLILYSI